MTCRNCDAGMSYRTTYTLNAADTHLVGHMSRECPEKKDWSRVKCQNCGEKGHGKARCPQPPADENAPFDNPGDGGLDASFGGMSIDAGGAAAAPAGDWDAGADAGSGW